MPPGPCEAFYRKVAYSVGGPILELACGTGRLSIPLALDGHDVVALDASSPMLNAASDKARARGADISLVRGDMRTYDLHSRFGLVIVSCNSLGHMTSDDALDERLRSIERHLAPDGILAFDVVNPNICELAGQMREQEAPDSAAGSLQVHRELVAYDPVAQVQRLRWRLLHRPEGELIARMELRAFFPREIAPRLSLAGLRLLACYGDFDGGPLTASSSNQVCLATCR